jgi:hypothetical protein
MSVPFVVSPAIRSAATTNQLAIVSFWTATPDTGMSISFNPILEHNDSLVKALTRLGQLTNQPTLSTLRGISFGHGKGARFAQQVAMSAPNQVAAVISYHSFDIQTPAWVNTAPYSPTVNTLKNTPHAVISAETEGPEINGGLRPYLADTMRFFTLQRRAQGELIHQFVEMNASHYFVDPKGMQYLAGFIGKTVALRMPTPGSLAALTEASGYLARFVVTTTPQFLDVNLKGPVSQFTPASYVTSSFVQANAASSYWLYDAAHADLWKASHIAPIVISDISWPFGQSNPYISGQRFSRVSLAYSFKHALNTILSDTNIMAIEVSNAFGDFNDPKHPPMRFGSKLIKDTVGYDYGNYLDTLAQNPNPSKGFATGFLSNNLQYDYATPSRRYRTRLITTSPELQSNNSGEWNNFAITRPFAFFLAPFPAGTKLVKGSQFQIRVIKTPTAVFLPTNRFILELSDSAGSFTNAAAIAIVADTAATIGATNEIVLRGTIPANALTGFKYRIRVRATAAPAAVDGSNNGSDLTIGSIVTGLDQEEIASDATPLTVYPNPSSADVTLRLDFQNAGNTSFKVLNANGAEVLAGTLNKQVGVEQFVLPTQGLPKGAYFVKVIAANKVYTTKLMKQ